MSEYGFDIKFYALLLPVFLLDLLVLVATMPLLCMPYLDMLENDKVPFVLRLYKEKRR